ncbi:preprotein translocase subunit SecG [Thermodesulfovibrio aggregans]|uniref:Protein-export membrane protein SecG n=1 Tax=Thermodesulfovibrio aggregans TaxID=86166 RepID=A0A0U9HTL6_9BACT|nr:preprotein translocase subunit SecG [Thermodesulfovibrio aggregans]GAQ94129.1 preprotein translocase subunit SecG [Thermodesulfovibrio aggregans]
MKTLLLTFHIILCIVMIAVVLLHRGKGAELGPAFGGGSSQTLFGPRGATTFLNKVATIVAVLFMISSFFLTYITTKSKSVVSDVKVPVQTQPLQQPQGAQPQQK